MERRAWRIREVDRLTRAGLSADEIAVRLDVAQRQVVRDRAAVDDAEPTGGGPVAADYPAFDGTQTCAGADPELFFPKGVDLQLAADALTYCRACTFLRGCLAYALTAAVEGVWGGTTDAQRARLRAVHGITAAPAAPDTDIYERTAV